MPPDKISSHTIEELVALAKTEEPEFDKAKPDQRILKDIESFIAEYEIKSGRKKVHSLVLFDIYLKWQLTTSYQQLNRNDFMKGMLYFFPKHYDNRRNIVFKLSPKHKAGRFDLSNTHLQKLRDQHGKKAKEKDQEVSEQISGTEPGIK